MRALVVYESHFGNTMDVAHAVLSGLRRHHEAEIIEVTSAPRDVVNGFDLLVLGAPTHAFGLSRPESRRQAIALGAEAQPGEIGLREWLETLSLAPGSCSFATFGTTADKMRRATVLGTAAGKLERRLRRLGLRQLAPCAQFWVADMTGPLLAGEEERAREWGAALGRDLLLRKGTPAPGSLDRRQVTQA